MEVAVLAFTVGTLIFFVLFIPAIAWGAFYDRFLRKPDERLPELKDHANLILASAGTRSRPQPPQPSGHH